MCFCLFEKYHTLLQWVASLSPSVSFQNNSVFCLVHALSQSDAWSMPRALLLVAMLFATHVVVLSWSPTLAQMSPCWESILDLWKLHFTLPSPSAQGLHVLRETGKGCIHVPAQG